MSGFLREPTVDQLKLFTTFRFELHKPVPYKGYTNVDEEVYEFFEKRIELPEGFHAHSAPYTILLAKDAEGSIVSGIVILSELFEAHFDLVVGFLATAEHMQGKGIANIMLGLGINLFVKRRREIPNYIIGECNESMVDFYRSLGFSIASPGEEAPPRFNSEAHQISEDSDFPYLVWREWDEEAKEKVKSFDTLARLVLDDHSH